VKVDNFTKITNNEQSHLTSNNWTHERQRPYLLRFCFYCLFIYVLVLKLQLWEGLGIPVAVLTQPHVDVSCQYLDIPTPKVVVFHEFNCLRWDVICSKAGRLSFDCIVIWMSSVYVIYPFLQKIVHELVCHLLTGRYVVATLQTGFILPIILTTIL
jgi:hypothetical protein